MASYTMDEVVIEGKYPVQKILELSMDIGVNRHGEFTYGGLVTEEEAEQYLRRDGEKEIVNKGFENNRKERYNNQIPGQNNNGIPRPD